jgi:asparagine synthase (glutamine-hydrolysing)
MSVALGFRRLSIIDLEGAKQPLKNEDKSLWLIFNGEIYNFVELRKEMVARGHRFSSDGDGEVILHLFEEYGTGCFSFLNGMFAIALWDSRSNRLILARDRLGKKPLYFCQQYDRLLFASELKCFFEVPGFDPDINPEAIDDYLTYQYVPHPKTIWKGIQKLTPGHFAEFKDRKLKIGRYWEYDPGSVKSLPKADAISRLRELLEDSVALRLRSDVPLGAFLSGGVDSSLIVAIAQGKLARPIRTFSIGFPDHDFDETQYAALVAKHLGTEHTRFEVSPKCVDVVEKLAWHYDEPFGDSSAVPTWYLSQLTKGSVTVALSGDGGDELFAGYDRYRALSFSQALSNCFPLHLVPGVKLLQRLPDSSHRRSVVRRLKRFLEASGQPPASKYMNWLQIFSQKFKTDLYSTDFNDQLVAHDSSAFLKEAWHRAETRSLVTQASFADLVTYLPCDLMTKVDIASMAHGLEVRCPMLDYRLVEFAMSLPSALKLRHFRGKAILKDAFGESLPPAIWRRPKMGFGVPIARWFRGELRPMIYEFLLAPDARVNSFFNTSALQRLVIEHDSGKQNHGYRLWSLLMLEAWMRTWQGKSRGA